ncbi:hypothetical protein BU202_06700 [Streptococcus cuniculi]|uniref:Gram-positive cocci surface proteins LPxTG domain-containing protein n=1 Tax=Streptococcus cuniculi TaxID=1432788 RepID=A0A1Q8E7E3_9STRE|nr:LPXTG cell wall anchor domain-containing protein [Streptococcus cuniculi]OLF47715.1 hypothetical protein BU202_06700 [Streptococcus cuniculi]
MKEESTKEWANGVASGDIKEPEICVPKKDLKIKKVDSLNKDKVLAGVKFAVSNAAGTVNTTVTTDANGEAIVSDLEFGNYTVTELEAPAGYVLDSEPKAVALDDTAPAIVTYQVENVGTGSVKVTKVDADNKSKLLPGVVFALKQGDTEVAQATTGADGVALFENVPYGDYTLVEVSTVAGYVLSGETRNVKITEVGQVVDLSTFENRQIKGSVTVTKVDAADEFKVLPGVVFVLKQGDKVIAEAKTDSRGTATFKNILHGTYTLAEKSTIDGYVLSDETREVTISEDGQVVDLGKFANKKKPTPTPPSSSTPSSSSSTEPSSSTSTSLPPTSGTTPPPGGNVPAKPKVFLPRTGETASVWMGVMGLALVVLAGFVYRVKKEK